MKLRSAFVSNSSSSSFIFVFDKEQKIPSNEKEVEEFLFINPLLKENKLFKYEYSDDLINITSIVNYILSSFKQCKFQDRPIELGDLKNSNDFDEYYNTIYSIMYRYVEDMCYLGKEQLKRKDGKGHRFALREETVESELPTLEKFGFKNINIEKIKLASQLSYEYEKVMDDEYHSLYQGLIEQLCASNHISRQDMNKPENNELYKKIYKEADYNPELKRLNKKMIKLSKAQCVMAHQITKEMVDNFFKDNPDKKLVAIDCSDNDSSPGSYCEHSGLFAYHKCLIVSNH